jgi:hypothetical protein
MRQNIVRDCRAPVKHNNGRSFPNPDSPLHLGRAGRSRSIGSNAAGHTPSYMVADFQCGPEVAMALNESLQM